MKSIAPKPASLRDAGFAACKRKENEIKAPKPASLRDAGFAALCGGAGIWLVLARVWLCEDL